MYEFFQKKQLFEIEDPMKDKMHLLLPHFQRNTAAMLMKNIELNRIVEDKEKFRSKVEALTSHYDQTRKEKTGLSRIK